MLLLMDNREIRAKADRADWQVTLGVTAAVGLIAWRLLSVSVLALGNPPQYDLALATLSEACVCALLAWRLRAGSVPAATALFVIWLAGFAYSWYSSEASIPPFFLISLLIAAGLFQGIVGALARREHASISTSLPPER
jgi:hypothetical protein